VSRSLISLYIFLAGIAAVIILCKKLYVKMPLSPPVQQAAIYVVPSHIPSQTLLVPPPPPAVSNSAPPPFVPPAVVSPGLSNVVDRRLDFVERGRGVVFVNR
jgi:hypothetical protein